MISNLYLNTVPFLSSTDSSRAAMSCKQFLQTLTHLNCDIPYVMGKDYEYLCQGTPYLRYARSSGIVIYNDYDLMIVKYDDDTVDKFSIPIVKKVYSIFGTKLRFSLPARSRFKEGDILYCYDGFTTLGLPSYGYNTYCAFLPFFGFNHEDAIVVSESLCNRARVTLADKIYIFIYEYTLMKPIFNNKLRYFPEIGERLKDGILCCALIPEDALYDTSSGETLKQKVEKYLRRSSLSKLINTINFNQPSLEEVSIKTKISNGVITGIKIHRLRPSDQINMIDLQLKRALESIWSEFSEKYIKDAFVSLLETFSSPDLARNLLLRYFTLTNKVRKDITLDEDLMYIIELEISDEECITYGDKLCNRYANKGVVSLIIPDELRPVTLEDRKPIDIIFNPFGVFSRMNLGQILELMVNESVMRATEIVRNDNTKLKEVLQYLRDKIIAPIDAYSVDQFDISRLDNDKSYYEYYIRLANEYNLFVTIPSFVKVNVKELLSGSGIKYQKSIVISKKLINYIRDKLNDTISDLVVNQDSIIVPNILSGPTYVQRLGKLSELLYNTRDFGPIHTIIGQPTRGRSRSGGCHVGEMEVQAFVSNGCIRSLHELLTIKSDWVDHKDKLLSQIVYTGQYHLDKSPSDKETGVTKQVIESYIKFLKQ